MLSFSACALVNFLRAHMPFSLVIRMISVRLCHFTLCEAHEFLNESYIYIYIFDLFYDASWSTFVHFSDLSKNKTYHGLFILHYMITEREREQGSESERAGEE